MTIKEFTDNFRKAFGDKPYLPIALWHSNEPVSLTVKANGCIFKHLNLLTEGGKVSLNADNIGCGGGKLYCGYSEMPEFVPNFVSSKERYKQSPELVVDIIESMEIRRADNTYLNFARIDTLDSFDEIEGLIFLATPDVLSGLFTWACYDRNEPDVVSTLFGSGCSNVITQTVNENINNGYRSFFRILRSFGQTLCR